jgi:hypothetical protein
LDSDVVVMVNGAGLMVMLSCCVTETGPGLPPDESVNFAVKVEDPGAVGMPEIAPAALKERPAGNDEPDARLQVNVPAPPLACSVAL